MTGYTGIENPVIIGNRLYFGRFNCIEYFLPIPIRPTEPPSLLLLCRFLLVRYNDILITRFRSLRVRKRVLIASFYPLLTYASVMSTRNDLSKILLDVKTIPKGPKAFYDLDSIAKNDDRTGYIFTSLHKWEKASGIRGSNGEKAQQVVVRDFMKTDGKQVRICSNFAF
jgi:hypothetical protein